MRTIKDAYALPNIDETFSALSGAKCFSVMDLKSGYYQVEVAEVLLASSNLIICLKL